MFNWRGKKESKQSIRVPVSLLDGGFLSDLGSSQWKRIRTKVLSEFGLGFVAGDLTQGLILALGLEFVGLECVYTNCD